MNFLFNRGELPIQKDGKMVIRCPYCHEVVVCDVHTQAGDLRRIELGEYYEKHKDCFPDTTAFDMQIPRPKGNGDE